MRNAVYMLCQRKFSSPLAYHGDHNILLTSFRQESVREKTNGLCRLAKSKKLFGIISTEDKIKKTNKSIK